MVTAIAHLQISREQEQGNRQRNGHRCNERLCFMNLRCVGNQSRHSQYATNDVCNDDTTDLAQHGAFVGKI